MGNRDTAKKQPSRPIFALVIGRASVFHSAKSKVVKAVGGSVNELEPPNSTRSVMVWPGQREVMIYTTCCWAPNYDRPRTIEENIIMTVCTE